MKKKTFDQGSDDYGKRGYIYNPAPKVMAREKVIDKPISEDDAPRGGIYSFTDHEIPDPDLCTILDIITANKTDPRDRGSWEQSTGRELKLTYEAVIERIAKEVIIEFRTSLFMQLALKDEFNKIGLDIVPISNQNPTTESVDDLDKEIPVSWDDETHATDNLPSLLGVTHEQMQAYRVVAAAMSRAHRANLTSEQAARENKQAAKRVAAFRARMTPEQRAARSETEAARLRRKRALAKTPQP